MMNDQALMGLITTGSTLTLRSIQTTISSLRLATPISEREVGYNYAIKDILNIIDIYAKATTAKQAEQDAKTKESANE